jgi:hypothetical protein
VVVGPTSLGLTVFSIPVFAGDCDNNGCVEAAACTIWRDNVDAPTGTLQSDSAGGTVGQRQYTPWAQNYGALGSRALTPSTAFPEPASLMMLASAAAIHAGRPSPSQVRA